MMREILFRGKRIDNGEWAFGFYVETERYNNLHWIWDGKEYVAVDPSTVGQYTGLTDKNGKKIFEGDILEFRRGRTHTVKFEDGAYIFTGTAIPVRYADKFKVIGNIHDNPELLESECE